MSSTGGKVKINENTRGSAAGKRYSVLKTKNVVASQTAGDFNFLSVIGDGVCARPVGRSVFCFSWVGVCPN